MKSTSGKVKCKINFNKAQAHFNVSGNLKNENSEQYLLSIYKHRLVCKIVLKYKFG